MKYIILDSKGRRMVHPRASEQEAIDVLTRGVAGRLATTTERQRAWEKLLGRGFRVVPAPHTDLPSVN